MGYGFIAMVDLLEGILTPFFWHNSSGISSPLKSKKNMPGKQPLHKFISINLKPLKPSHSYGVAFQKKWYCTFLCFPQACAGNIGIEQIFGDFSPPFSCFEKNRPSQGARKGVDHLKEILGTLKAPLGGFLQGRGLE